ncbi:MAG TPA: transglutaminase family protein [Polyangia bacterium]|nr:transglutaminase family protein [Polyangia bacterium]
MSITVSLHHKTKYAYDRPVRLEPHVVRLRPAPHCRTAIRAYSLKVEPGKQFLNWQQDPFGNYQARLVFPQEANELTIDVDLIAELTAINPFDFFIEERAERFPFTYDPRQLIELAPYLLVAPSGPHLDALRSTVEARVCRPGRRTIDVLVDINQQVQRLLRYDIRMEPGVFPPEETLVRGHGSCRDFAWLLVQLLRQLGFAARFVSGYSIQLVADVKPLDGPPGVSQDVTDLHAWTEVFLPGAGWIGFDPTSGLMCGEGHIPLACTAEPASAAPVSGGFRWTKRAEGDELTEKFAFEMRVDRLHEHPRVTKPYTEQQWAAIDALGHQIDRALAAGDVRLSMGGEPTFVSIDDPEGAEWNTAAVGTDKLRLSDQLVRRLQKRFAPGGLLHFGQGKWYPGEPLPRWALTCFFRKDGHPLWHHPMLVASDETPPPRPTAARDLVSAIAHRLGVDEASAVAAYEDAFYYMWRERRLPTNVDLQDARLDDEMERARLARVFEQGLNRIVGYALPLQGLPSASGAVDWRTGPWFLRTERMYLHPGDSPMGFRLPLDSLPWAVPGDRGEFFDPDPLAPRPPLPRLAPPVPVRLVIPQPGRAGDGEAGDEREREREREDQAPPARGSSAGHIVRTALCVEPRDGKMRIFMPPLESLEAYLQLVSAVEQAASDVSTPVMIEGYAPPRDPRLGQLAVTPDPGVIEVNIHPAMSWDELAANTSGLYEDARQTRLATEKFMLDGRHSGTGGGNHVVLGGPTAADSPFLRRPDLLRSFIGYFLNHPSLSYMFSGMFVGPTSQAPRIDEARQESVDELEIAFRQIDERAAGAPTPPWLVDRIFRNLLVDVTGNTHRAELCIDKMYNPDSASGRQGLLELRAFEMPPHARMSLAQQLVLRGLTAMFWDKPYRERPIRWGTALHDRFTLPFFVEQDFGEVIEDLQQAGFPFAADWFAAHHEFRFPSAGSIAARGMTLELRQAIEPWMVLGEQGAVGGTARYVDSSLERLQVQMKGFTDDRFAVLCNGRRVPLHPTGSSGQMVAGVRFRAWQPPSALHPRIGVHAPLTFDIVDGWNGRSIAGCTYHVAHPGGRAFDQLPRNALEAESRRASRFFKIGHTPGRPAAAPPARDERASRDFPLTLDLRR